MKRILAAAALTALIGMTFAGQAQERRIRPSGQPIIAPVVTRPDLRLDPGRIRPLQTQCPQDAVVAEVVALDHPMVFNRLGAQNINWMMYALRRDVIDVKTQQVLDGSRTGNMLFEQVRSRSQSRGIALRPDLRARPLVLRVAAGQHLRVRLTNFLSVRPSVSPPQTPANPFNSDAPVFPSLDHPLDHAPRDAAGTPGDERIFQIDDQVASRSVGFHPQGLSLVGNITSDSSFVVANTDSLAAPGQTREYCFHAPEEGAFLVSNPGAAFGGEGTSGNTGVGLFGAVTVQPAKARFYRAQVTEEELRLATRDTTPTGQPVIDYEATYPDDCASNGVWCREGKAGIPILNILANNQIVHSDINAIVVGPNKDGSFPAGTYPLESRGLRNPTLPNRLEPFREFVSVYHDENAATQAFPYFFEHPELRHTLHGVRDAFMINYGSGGIGSEIIANRLQAGPMQDCLDCAYEEFFLSSFAVGDAAMLVDKPVALAVGRCQPEFVDAHYRKSKGLPYDDGHYEGFIKHCDWKGMGEGVRAEHAWYPHDPANVHHSYIGDAVKFRNLHAGKEQHIFHLHNHQWLFNPNDDNSNYIDAQAIGPGSGYTYEIAFGGSGNRNKTVGDAIFHCHFYPHFAQGMWYMWRNHDVMETGTRLKVSDATRDGFHATPFDLKNGTPAEKSRALPDGEIVAGTPIPAIVPLPGKALPPMPAGVYVTAKATGLGSKAELINTDVKENPGYPFWIAGVTEHADTPNSIGHRPTTPPLDMSTSAGGFDGGLPRHALAGYAEGGHSEALLTRLTAEKHLEAAKPIYFPETGTPLERVAMQFHAQRNHPSHKADMGGNVTAAAFVTNGAPPVPGAPYNEPCIDDRGRLLQTGDASGAFFGGASMTSMISVGDSLPGGIEYGADKPRIYKGANIQFDIVFNKLGYHYPQQRILALWDDVVPTLKKQRPPEPLVLRMNTFDCAQYQHTNLVPKDFYADDYQITTPTDVIGQHIHLPKWDLTSADGSANGWNYEDGTFSPGAVRERIAAINTWNAHATTPVPQPDGSTDALIPQVHPFFNASLGHQVKDCQKKWIELGGKFAEFEKAYGAHPGICDWLGARTTIQRWFSDPMVNTKGIHRGLGTTFTHDHLGPSTHQQLGLYATMLSEPPGSEWRHNETGELLYTRADGGPTTWQAIITAKEKRPLHVDDDGLDDSHREFFLQFGDFQHAYEKGAYVGVSEAGVPYKYDPSATAGPDSYRKAVHPSVRKPSNTLTDIFKYDTHCPGGKYAVRLYGAVYSAITPPLRPCPEAISADDVGMMVVNYRNEPVAARVYDPSTKTQASGNRGDLTFAFQTRTDRAIGELNSQLGNTPYPALTQQIHKGDPFTPIMRAYSGDYVRVKVQAGSHEHEHNGSINALAWLQAGSGYGQAPHSGWRNAQNTGLSEQFTFSARITDYFTRNNLNDRMYALDTSQDGIWNGVWGVLRSSNRRDPRDALQTLPSHPRPTLLAPWQGQVYLNDCPRGAGVRRYDVSAVLANRALQNSVGAVISAPAGSAVDPAGGTLIYNPRQAAITVQVFDSNGEYVRDQRFKAGPLHDPTAVLLVRNEDLLVNPNNPEDYKLIAGRPVEPLVLRAAAGECVQIVLHNRLPRARSQMPDLDGYTSLSGIVRKDGGSPGSDATSFNNNHIRPSNRIALHPQEVLYDVQDYDGSAVGVNHTSTIPPRWSQVYQWYAGTVDMVSSAESCPTDTERADPVDYERLSAFPKQPELRSLNQVYDQQTLQDAAYTLLMPEYKTRDSQPDEETVSLAKALAGATPADCFETVAATLANTPTLTRERLAILQPQAMRQVAAPPRTGTTATDALDEAPLLEPDAMVDRMARYEKRIQCATNRNLAAIYSAEIGKTRYSPRAQDVAQKLERSFAYEVAEIDDDGSFAEAFAWRLDSYPSLTPETTRLAAQSRACRFSKVEFGGSNLSPPDRVKQGQKAAVGALVIEPAGARWLEYYDDVGIDRQNPGAGQSNARPMRASANVRYPVRDANGATVYRWMRDLTVVHQKGLNFRYGGLNRMLPPGYSNGDPVANLAAEREDAQQSPMRTAPEDAHDSGHMAINYGSEPLWYRFGLAPDAAFGITGFAGIYDAWQAFANTCCGSGGTASTAAAPVGQPYVPIFTAPNGMETRLRVLMPSGVGRGTTFALHGHGWPRDPYLAENVTAGWPVGGSHATWGTPSQCIGANPMHMFVGGQDSVTPMAHYDVVLPWVGHGVVGDYLWRDMAGFGITSGLWGVLRVQGETQAALPMRPDCR